jgi:hypothetical protein
MKLGIKMSTINLPPAYSKNISLWSSVDHETGGLDVAHAYNGMLDELDPQVATKLLERQNDPTLKGTASQILVISVGCSLRKSYSYPSSDQASSSLHIMST